MNTLSPSDTPALLNEHDAARLLNCSVRTLQDWRQRKAGPAFVRVGSRLVRYPLSALTDFIKQNAPALPLMRPVFPPHSRMWELFTAGDPEGAIAYFVSETPGATIRDTRDIMAGLLPVLGDVALMAPGNLVLADHLSPEFAALVQRCVADGRVQLRCGEGAVKTVPPFEAVSVRLQRNLPVARRVPAGGYRSPHWLPVTLWPAQEVAA